MEFRFLLTPACNFRCKFCHEEGIKGCYKKVRLDVDDIEYVFSLGKKCFNWRTVTLTGGEPTLFGGISQLCKKLYDIGASITLQTNGSTLMENFNMLEYVSQVNISLHTMDPLFYKDIIGVSFPHDRLISNILYLRARFPLKRVHFNVVMTRDVFIASDGTFRPYANEDLEIDILYDIKKRKDENILEKINFFWNK